jgi:hypothetical protein
MSLAGGVGLVAAAKGDVNARKINMVECKTRS